MIVLSFVEIPESDIGLVQLLCLIVCLLFVVFVCQYSLQY